MTRSTMAKMAGVFCIAILGSTVAGRAQESYDSSKIATIEVEVTLGDDPTVVASGGPWEWSVGIWIVDGIPVTDVVQLRVVLRDVDGNGVYWGELEGLSVSAGLFGSGLLMLTPDPAGIEVLDPPVNFLGIVPLQPFSVDVPLDIRPGSTRNPFNPRSRGLLPTVILGSDELDVSEINVESLTLSGVAPARSRIDDKLTLNLDDEAEELSSTGSDGHDDLVLWFKSAEIADVIGDVSHGDELPMMLAGEMADGSAIEGVDFITVVGKGKSCGRSQPPQKSKKPKKSKTK